MILSNHGVIQSGKGVGGNLLLDGLSGVVAAWGERKLLSTYSGNQSEAVKSDGTTTQNIGFIGENKDTSTLLSFAASGDVFTKTLYDQIANFNLTNVTQSRRPRIVSAGSLESFGMRFFGNSSQTNLSGGCPQTTYPLTIVVVGSTTGNTNGAIAKIGSVLQGGNTNNGVGIGVGSGTFDNSGGVIVGVKEATAWMPTSTALSTTNPFILEIYINAGSAAQIYLNGNPVAIGAGSNTNAYAPTTSFFLGGYAGDSNGSGLLNALRYVDCKIAESFILNRELTSGERAALVANQKAFYSIP